MTLQAFFQWCEDTAIGTAIRDSSRMFPVLEAIHLIGLTMLLGTLLVIDIRLMGLGMRRQRVSEVAGDLKRWTLTGLVLMLSTGVLLFLSEAMKCYGNDAFFVKMKILAVAILFHFTLHRKVTSMDDDRRKPLLGAVTGMASLGLWFSVGLAGRAIGFL